MVNKKGAVNGEVKQTTPKKQDNNEEEDLSEQQQQEEESENMSNNCSSDNHNNSDDMAHHKLPVKGDKSCIDNSDDKSEDGDNNDRESVDGRNSSDQHKSLGMGENHNFKIVLHTYHIPNCLKDF